MSKILKIRGTILAILIVFLSLTGFSQDLVILHTNDTHSNIEPATSGRNIGMGGFQRRANYFQMVREENSNVLILDAGDYNQGTPYFTLFKGYAEIMLYNAMGYDAVCLGNHEFDNGQQQLAQRLKKANYPTLCANYDFSKSPLKDIIKPYIIINKGGRKIGIIGILLDLKGYVSEAGRANIEYKDPLSVANKIARKLKIKEGCDLVIVLSHIGFDEGTKKNPSDTELARYSKNIDIIIGGHSHTFLEEPVLMKNRCGKGVIVNQTGAAGVYVGRIDLTF
ncbi:MAG: metallophosphatase [Bacteroidales bacterium]